jgi:hypothetical protein
MGVRTRRRHALGTRFENFHGVTTREARRSIGHIDTDQFAGQGVSHEDDSAVVASSYAAARRRTFDSNRTDHFVNVFVLHHCSLLTAI